MSIRLKWNVDTTPLENAIGFLDSIDTIVAEVGEEVVQETTPELLNQLQYVPPRRSYPGEYPLEWSEKQRKAFWATDGFEAGIPFQRKGTLASRWQVTTQTTAGLFQIVIENTSSAARFVYGSLAKNIAAAQRFQQRFHRLTGWPLAAEHVNRWAERVQILFREKMQSRIGNWARIGFSRRAVTPRRK